MILIIDNYDSFTYNLYQLVQPMTISEVNVVRNDKITLTQIRQIAPACIILSPGPGVPDESRLCLEITQALGGEIPILGVCLGHQIIATVYGGIVGKAKYPLHGKGRVVRHQNGKLFNNIPNRFMAARYNSLIVNEESFPGDLVIDAYDDNGEIMAISHRVYPIYGVQFHPEAILTEHGQNIMQNFLEIANVKTIS